MTARKRQIIAVIGSSDPSPEEANLAEEVGRELARRNVIVVKSAQAVIAVGGSYGTLTEIAYALQNKIPVIGLCTWSFSRNGKKDKSIIPAKDAKEAVRIALEKINPSSSLLAKGKRGLKG